MAPQRHTTRVIPTLSTCARREPVLSRIRRNSGPRITRLVCVLLLVPFAVAAWLAARCSAWNGTVEGRCAKVRPRPFQRCELGTHSHAAQLVTAPEVVAVVSFLVGILGLWFFLTAR